MDEETASRLDDRCELTAAITTAVLDVAQGKVPQHAKVANHRTQVFLHRPERDLGIVALREVHVVHVMVAQLDQPLEVPQCVRRLASVHEHIHQRTSHQRPGIDERLGERLHRLRPVPHRGLVQLLEERGIGSWVRQAQPAELGGEDRSQIAEDRVGEPDVAPQPIGV